MLKLPNGISLVTVTRPGPGQPIRVKLPLTEPNQNWCTIRVNVPNHTVTCPESDLALNVKVLKKPADLAKKEKTTVRSKDSDDALTVKPAPVNIGTGPEGSPTWRPAKSERICRSSTTRPKPETTAGAGSPCQDRRSKNVLHIWEHSNKTTMLSRLLACLSLKLISPHKPPIFTYPDCHLIYSSTQIVFFPSLARELF